MADSGDLINFDIIEAQKENIQALPSGRSAKKLAEVFSPTAPPLHKLSTPTPTDTKNIHDCIRNEYEAEVACLADSDDPLDVFDRYVRWTLDTYPSAQATPQSQLHTLLERATKTFVDSAQYKNDPRYFKLWMLYIQFFSDAPRETFLFLSRHGIGEGLALFYEEYAAWLESADRWGQAQEVYKVGIERGARPQQRLMRRFEQFEQRLAQHSEIPNEPSSPALPTVRPVLAAKIDPFAAARAAAADPQAPRPSAGVGGQSSRPGKAKMSIFSDADAAAPVLSAAAAGSTGPRGGDSIDSLANRKKENVVEPKPWVGETLKGGGKKNAAPKMQIFRDKSRSQKSQLAKSHITLIPSHLQVVVNPVSGRRERVFVNLEAVYPTPEEPGSELSFEEIWAMNRGWLGRCWADPTAGGRQVDERGQDQENSVESLGHAVTEKLIIHTETVMLDENGQIQKKGNKMKKMRTTEINETQIIKANLDSPSKPRPKKRSIAEPTMTLHTKAATDEIYEIFNQPAQAPREESDDDDHDDDYETDGGYTSGAESTTTTTRHVDVSEAGDDETSDVKSVSEWSDFSTRRHVPDIDGCVDDTQDVDPSHISGVASSRHEDGQQSEPNIEADTALSDDDDLPHLNLEDPDTPLGPEEGAEEYEDDEYDQPRTKTMFVPIPPEDYEPRTRPYRDPAEVANNRLPFMTPIAERTETSLGAWTAQKGTQRESPLRRRLSDAFAEEDEEDIVDDIEDQDSNELFSSPLREVINDSNPARMAEQTPSVPASPKPRTMVLASRPIPTKGPIIKDAQCNPVDEAVRSEILANISPPLSSYAGFFDHIDEKYERGSELRRAVKAQKAKSGQERTSTAAAVALVEFCDSSRTFAVRRELGAGAFAPVYLVENSDIAGQDGEDGERSKREGQGYGGPLPHTAPPRRFLEAMKMEQPPSAWEFHMMRIIHTRLGPHDRVAASLSYAHEMHLYQDEGFLIVPFHPHGSLLDVVNQFRAEPSGVMDELLAMFFTVELLRTVEALHAHGLLHGDLKPDNCLLRLDGSLAGNGEGHDDVPLATQYRADGSDGWASRGVVLIDFGRGIDMRNFAPGTQFVADWKTETHDCAEMREGRPWTWQVDCHGLAGVIYCLLFGRYIETVRSDGPGEGAGIVGARRYRVRENLKRYWQAELWGECFDLLLNPACFTAGEQGGKMPVLRGMKTVRERMEVWLEENCTRGVGLKSLIGKVEAAAKMRR